MISQRVPKFLLLYSILLFLLTIFIASTAIRIELANSAMGGFLPRPQPPSIEGNDITWRVGGPVFAERSYRRQIAFERGLDLDDEELLLLELSETEQSQLSIAIDRSIANNRLRSLVSGVGLWQYPLVLINASCLLSMLFVSRLWVRLLATGLLAITGVCAYLMIYREYFSSLGW